MPKDSLPKSLSDFVERSAADWYGHAARVDVEIVRRGITAHAFHDRTWTRLFGGATANRKTTSPDNLSDDLTDEAHWRDDVSLLFPWWRTLQVEIVNRSTTFRVLIAQHRADSHMAAAEATYLRWLAYLLDGGSATRDALAESTICAYAEAVVPIVLSLLGEQDPAMMDAEQLADVYAESMLLRPSDITVSTLAKGSAY